MVSVTTTLFFFFFFQAEDGIRDLTVTGVQTCALPISFCCDVRVSTSSQVPAKLQEAAASMKNATAADLPVLLVSDLFSSKRPMNLASETASPPARNRTIQVLVCSFLI